MPSRRFPVKIVIHPCVASRDGVSYGHTAITTPSPSREYIVVTSSVEAAIRGGFGASGAPLTFFGPMRILPLTWVGHWTILVYEGSEHMKKRALADMLNVARKDIARLAARLHTVERWVDELALVPSMAHEVTHKVPVAQNLDSDFITPDEAAQRLGVSACTVRRYLRDGVLAGHRVGQRWELSPGAVSNFVRMRRVAQQIGESQ